MMYTIDGEEVRQEGSIDAKWSPSAWERWRIAFLPHRLDELRYPRRSP